MEQVILFGVGNAGKRSLNYIKEKYEIICWIDNNNNLWGKEYESIIVKSPEYLCNYSGKIIVTTSDSFFVEISEQLLELGFSKSQIYRCQHSIYDQKAEIIPFDISTLRMEDKKLIEYDLLKQEEKSRNRRVLIFSAFHTTYVVQLIKNIKQYFPDISLSLLSNSETYLDEIKEYVEHIYVYHTYSELYGLLNAMPKYDVFQTLWIENIWVFFSDLIREKCVRLNVGVGGSDLYRGKNTELRYKEKLINLADCVSAQTTDTIANFLKCFPQAADKIRWINYGVEVIEYINEATECEKLRREFKLPKNKIIVTCGHNANKAHQHIRMIEELQKLDIQQKKKIHFVFPMTYPNEFELYIEEVRKRLDSSGLEYTIINKFMNIKEMAAYAKISDMMIHVQTTDQLSSAMLEQMYAGKIIIAGDWLPYQMLREKGIKFWTINKMEELSELVSEVIANFEEYKTYCWNNEKEVYKLSAWNIASERWVNAWDI